MPIRDRSIGWKYGQIWLPIRSFAGFDNNGTADVTLSEGSPTLEPLGTIEIAGLPMDLADEVHTVIPIPWNMNRDKKVLGRVWFFHYATGADTPIFKVGVAFFAKLAAAAEIKAGADVDVAFAAHTCSTTANSLEITKWTDLQWNTYITELDVLAGITLELDNLGSALADECKVIGLEIGYEIEATTTHRRKSHNMAAANPLMLDL